jgi:hypothetical protein
MLLTTKRLVTIHNFIFTNIQVYSQSYIHKYTCIFTILYSQICGAAHKQAVGYYSNLLYYSKYSATIQNQNFYSVFAITSLSNIRLLFYRIVLVGKTKFYNRCAMMFVKSYSVLTICLTNLLQKQQSLSLAILVTNICDKFLSSPQAVPPKENTSLHPQGPLLPNSAAGSIRTFTQFFSYRVPSIKTRLIYKN